MNSQSRSRQGQMFEWLIAAVGNIHIAAGEPRCRLV